MIVLTGSPVNNILRGEAFSYAFSATDEDRLRAVDTVFPYWTEGCTNRDYCAIYERSRSPWAAKV